MPLPKKIEILNHTVDVILQDQPKLNGEDVSGLANIGELKLNCKSNLPPSLEKEIILHELLHFLVYFYIHREDPKEEDFVGILSNGLLTVMKNNPKLKDYLFND